MKGGGVRNEEDLQHEYPPDAQVNIIFLPFMQNTNMGIFL
jgi:hypothetical protein